MRVILIAISIALLATQAFAQMGGKGPPSGDDKAGKAAAERQKRLSAEEEAAKAAMSKIPDSKEKYDPWKIAR